MRMPCAPPIPAARVILAVVPPLVTPTDELAVGSIPADYTTLVWRLSLRSTKPDYENSFALRLNNDAGDNYDQEFVQSYNGVANGWSHQGADRFYGCSYPAVRGGVGNFGYVEIRLPWYAAAGRQRAIQIVGGYGTRQQRPDDPADRSTRGVALVAGRWACTDAVHTVTVLAEGAHRGYLFAVGCQAVLYGEA